MNDDHYTERVRAILALAREEAVGRRHTSVDTEHILLGIIREGVGVAAAALQNLGVDLDVFQARVEDRLTPRSSAHPDDGALPYSTRGKRILERAMAISRDLNHA